MSDPWSFLPPARPPKTCIQKKVKHKASRHPKMKTLLEASLAFLLLLYWRVCVVFVLYEDWKMASWPLFNDAARKRANCLLDEIKLANYSDPNQL